LPIAICPLQIAQCKTQLKLIKDMLFKGATPVKLIKAVMLRQKRKKEKNSSPFVGK
jgi:hypothetical protein